MTTGLSVKMGTQTNRPFRDFAVELGVPASSLVNNCIRQMLRDRKAAFSTVLEPTPYLENLMREASEDITAGRNVTTFKIDRAVLARLRPL
jgi:hypothetical protein